MKILIEDFDAGTDSFSVCCIGELYIITDDNGRPVWLITYRGKDVEIGTKWSDEKDCMYVPPLSEFDYARSGVLVKDYEAAQAIRALREKQDEKRKEIEKIEKDVGELSSIIF